MLRCIYYWIPGPLHSSSSKRDSPGRCRVCRPAAVKRSTNLNGNFERKQVWLHSLKLGAAEFGQEPAFVVHDRSDTGRDFDGLMSPAALGITRIAVDLEREVLAFSH